MIDTDTPRPSPSLRRRWAEVSGLDCVVLGSVVVMLVALGWYLLPFWRAQPELSHGYFALPCALALLWASRREANFAGHWSRPAAATVAWVLFLLGSLAACVTALAALAQGPLHMQTAFLAGFTASVFVLSGILLLARLPMQWVRGNGRSLAAALLWWFVLPLPGGMLSRFTLFLQDFITAGSLRALHVLGYPALRHGNVIQLPNTLVGVEEACSGIRSLTACLFAGVVLGGFMLVGLRRRVLLVFAAGFLAVATNFLRSTLLCLLAARGVEIKGFWHDATALGVLALTALVLFGFCLLLGPRSHPPETPDALPPYTRWPLVTHTALGGVFALLIAVVATKIVPADSTRRAPPDLAALMVIDQPGWQRLPDPAISEFSEALGTTHLRQETYLRGDLQLTFYVAFWTSDESTLGAVALHTPEICLPGSGWTTRPPPAPPAGLARYALPAPRRFAFEKDGYPQQVWFWHFFNGRIVEPTPSLYPWHLAPALLKRGISARAPQWVVRVSSNRPLESLLAEPLLQEFFHRLRALDLAGGDVPPR